MYIIRSTCLPRAHEVCCLHGGCMITHAYSNILTSTYILQNRRTTTVYSTLYNAYTFVGLQ